MSRSRDWNELQHTWIEWRRRTGQKTRDMFEQLVDVSNQAALLNSALLTVENVILPFTRALCMRIVMYLRFWFSSEEPFYSSSGVATPRILSPRHDIASPVRITYRILPIFYSLLLFCPTIFFRTRPAAFSLVPSIRTLLSADDFHSGTRYDHVTVASDKDNYRFYQFP